MELQMWFRGKAKCSGPIGSLFMSTASLVLKCRTCGENRPAGFSCAKHRDLDHCDGSLEQYCSICKKFTGAPSCSLCERRSSDEADRARHQRQAVIKRWRSYPVILQLHWAISQSTWGKRAVDDFEYRCGLQVTQKRDLKLICAGLCVGVLLPPSYSPVVFMCIVICAYFIISLTTLPNTD